MALSWFKTARIRRRLTADSNKEKYLQSVLTYVPPGFLSSLISRFTEVWKALFQMKEATGLLLLLHFLVGTMWRTHLTFDLRIQHFISLFFYALSLPVCCTSVLLLLTLSLFVFITHTWTLLTTVLLSMRSVNMWLFDRDNQPIIHLLPSLYKGMFSDDVTLYHLHCNKKRKTFTSFLFLIFNFFFKFLASVLLLILRWSIMATLRNKK